MSWPGTLRARNTEVPLQLPSPPARPITREREPAATVTPSAGRSPRRRRRTRLRDDLEPPARALLDIGVVGLGALAVIPVLRLRLGGSFPLDVYRRRGLHHDRRGVDRIGVDVGVRIPEGDPDADPDEDATA